jgi:hypothetical protein
MRQHELMTVASSILVSCSTQRKLVRNDCAPGVAAGGCQTEAERQAAIRAERARWERAKEKARRNPSTREKRDRRTERNRLRRERNIWKDRY